MNDDRSRWSLFALIDHVDQIEEFVRFTDTGDGPTNEIVMGHAMCLAILHQRNEDASRSDEENRTSLIRR